MGGIEQRRVRFDSIEGLRREHLETAGEIWLADICTAIWGTREVMKLSAHLVRYMLNPDPRQLKLGMIEAITQVGREELKFALRIMKLYRAIEAFSIDQDEVRVALHLTRVQRLKVLETEVRLAELMQRLPAAEAGERWVPSAAENDGDCEDTAESELARRLKRASLAERPSPSANAPERQVSASRPRP